MSWRTNVGAHDQCVWSSPATFSDPIGHKPNVSFDPSVPGIPSATDIVRMWHEHKGPFADPNFREQVADLLKRISRDTKKLASDAKELAKAQKEYDALVKSCPPKPSKAKMNRMKKLKEQIDNLKREMRNLERDLLEAKIEYGKMTAALAGDAMLPVILDIWENASNWSSATYWAGQAESGLGGK